MARKAKTQTEDKEITKAELKEELKQEAVIDEKIAEEQLKESEVSENLGDLGEDKPKKKKEIKKLSESELKRVMTDTKETLVPLTDYIACSVHLGTKVITPDMRKFVYKRRADGLAVLNTNLIDDKLREAVKMLNQFDAKDVFIACKREAGWPAVEKFSEVTGIRCFCKKYPAGIITNIILDNFFEAKMVLVCDPWVDKNALNDALKLDLPVMGICDTNNYAQGIKQIIPANNKSRKSIGIVLYILAREYLKSQGKSDEAKALKMEDFTGKVEVLESVNAVDVKTDKEKASEGV
jgi:small subunit ribosomal protein S2